MLSAPTPMPNARGVSLTDQLVPRETAAVEAPPRFHVLAPSGVRLVRLGPQDGAGFLIEYDRILRVAIADFLRRGHIPGTVDGVLTELAVFRLFPG
jgi:hypothetical protein